MTSDAHAGEPSAGIRAEPLYATAYLAPWVGFSLFLPEPQRGAAVVLLVLLGALLVAAGVWSRRHATAVGLDGAAWSFGAVASLGFSMVVLLVWRPQPGETAPTYLCHGCGRLGAYHEPFCFGCGAHA